MVMFVLGCWFVVLDLVVALGDCFVPCFFGVCFGGFAVVPAVEGEVV